MYADGAEFSCIGCHPCGMLRMEFLRALFMHLCVSISVKELQHPRQRCPCKRGFYHEIPSSFGASLGSTLGHIYTCFHMYNAMIYTLVLHPVDRRKAPLPLTIWANAAGFPHLKFSTFWVDFAAVEWL